MLKGIACQSILRTTNKYSTNKTMGRMVGNSILKTHFRIGGACDTTVRVSTRHASACARLTAK